MKLRSLSDIINDISCTPFEEPDSLQVVFDCQVGLICKCDLDNGVATGWYLCMNVSQYSPEVC